jgi:hypothetical protein
MTERDNVILVEWDTRRQIPRCQLTEHPQLSSISQEAVEDLDHEVKQHGREWISLGSPFNIMRVLAVERRIATHSWN